MKGALEEDGSETSVRCKFGMRPFVVGFMTFWFGGVVLLSSAGLIMSLTSSTPHGSNSWADAIIPIGMIAFGAGLVGFGRYLARDENAFLTQFVCDTIEARVVPTSDLA